EHNDEKYERRAHERLIRFRHLRQNDRQIGNVERAQHSVNESERDQKQSRRRQIKNDIGNARSCPLRTASVRQQSVGRRKQNFEKDEEIENIARQKCPVEAGKLKLKKRVKATPFRVCTGNGIKQRRHG